MMYHQWCYSGVFNVNFGVPILDFEQINVDLNPGKKEYFRLNLYVLPHQFPVALKKS